MLARPTGSRPVQTKVRKRAGLLQAKCRGNRDLLNPLQGGSPEAVGKVAAKQRPLIGAESEGPGTGGDDVGVPIAQSTGRGELVRGEAGAEPPEQALGTPQRDHPTRRTLQFKGELTQPRACRDLPYVQR